MLSQYDENLNENLFFNEIYNHHADIIKSASEKNWIICVPRAGSFEATAVDSNTIFDHILVPDDSSSSHKRSYNTLSKKSVNVAEWQISYEDCKLFSINVQILFEETFYAEKVLKYTVWCIDRPLFSEYVNCELHKPVILESLNDCIDFLWVESLSYDILSEIQRQCLSFVNDHQLFEEEDFQTQKELIGCLYSKCLQVAFKNKHISRKAQQSNEFIENLKQSVESYMQHCVHDKLMGGIHSYFYCNDAHLNKILKNSSDLTLHSFNLKETSNNELVNAKCELCRINGLTTVLDKVKCLERTISVIYKNDFNKYFTSDVILQFLTFLILKTNGINNWVSNLIFMKEFRFSSLDLTNYSNYLITSLEATLEYIKSTDFLSLTNTVQSKVTDIPIFDAIKRGNLYVLKKLLTEKADVKDVKELNLCHPLCICEKCVTLLKNQNNNEISINMVNSRDQSLLIVATIYEQTEVVEFLITDKNCDLNLPDYEGRTALHYAAMKGYQDILLLLITADANINIKDVNGNSVLHLATYNGHNNCVKALVYSSQEIEVNSINKFGDTALHFAAKFAYFSIVQILLENFASASILNKKQQRAIDVAHNHYIANYIKQFDGIEIIEMPQYANMKPHEKEPNDSAQKSPKFGMAPKCGDQMKKVELLLKAIENNDLPLTCFYLGFAINATKATPSKCHPLCNCDGCKLPDVETTPPKKNPVNVNFCNSEGYTPLHVAAKFGRSEILRLLLDSEAQTGLKTYKTLYTALHLACIYQRIQIVRELLLCGNQEVNEQDYLGNTPLFYACFKNDTRIVELLLGNEANCNIKNLEGKTVWDESQIRKLYGIFKILKNYSKVSFNKDQ